MIHDRQDIIGKTITGVITRGAGRSRNPSIIMLQFSDGTYFEFVSPAALNSLTRYPANTTVPGTDLPANDAVDPTLQLAISGV
jgi:hypothetical protein